MCCHEYLVVSEFGEQQLRHPHRMLCVDTCENIIEHEKVEPSLPLALVLAEREKNAQSQRVEMGLTIVSSRILSVPVKEARTKVHATLPNLAHIKPNPAVTLIWMECAVNSVDVLCQLAEQCLHSLLAGRLRYLREV